MSERDPATRAERGQSNADLERRLHEALGRVPARRAPQTLRPRVMAAVRARASRRWYEPAWDAWPLAVRVAVVGAGAVVLAAGALWIAGPLTEAAQVTASAGGRVWAWLAGVPLPAEVQRAVELLSMVRVVWRTVLGPVLFYAAVFSMVVGGLFAGCAMLVTRLALGRAVA